MTISFDHIVSLILFLYFLTLISNIHLMVDYVIDINQLKDLGDLHFVYYDRRRYEDNRTDVIWTTSTDGAQTFKEQRISAQPFTPSPLVFFGDYLGIAAYDGRVRPIWPRMDSGKISLWVALIDLE